MDKEIIFSELPINVKSDIVLTIFDSRPYLARACQISEIAQAVRPISGTEEEKSLTGLIQEVKEIVDGLVEDKYVRKAKTSFYKITAKGIRFKESGGYVEQDRRDNENQNNAKSMLRFTAIIAIGTLISALVALTTMIIDLYKSLHGHQSNVTTSNLLISIIPFYNYYNMLNILIFCILWIIEHKTQLLILLSIISLYCTTVKQKLYYKMTYI